MLNEEAEGGQRVAWAHVILGADSEPHPVSFSNVRVGLDQDDKLVMAPYYVSNESFTLFNYGRQATSSTEAPMLSPSTTDDTRAVSSSLSAMHLESLGRSCLRRSVTAELDVYALCTATGSPYF